MEQGKKYIPPLQYIKYNIPQDYNNDIQEETKKKEYHDEKAERFKGRLQEFKKIATLEAAKDLLQRTMPVVLDRTVFFIGKSKCTIINTDKHVRICYDSPEEFIGYDFE